MDHSWVHATPPRLVPLSYYPGQPSVPVECSLVVCSACGLTYGYSEPRMVCEGIVYRVPLNDRGA